MKIIAHRGNCNGPDKSTENLANQIDTCINLNFDVEIDLWAIENKLFLGHDEPSNPISSEWILERSEFLWIHCKNFNSLNYLIQNHSNLNFFWHQKDDYTITSKKYFWTYPGKTLSKNSVCVLPEWEDEELKNLINLDCYGVCTDYPILAKTNLLSKNNV